MTTTQSAITPLREPVSTRLKRASVGDRSRRRGAGAVNSVAVTASAIEITIPATRIIANSFASPTELSRRAASAESVVGVWIRP